MVKYRLYIFIWVCALLSYAHPTYALSCASHSLKTLLKQPHIMGNVMKITPVDVTHADKSHYEIYVDVYEQAGYAQKVEKITVMWDAIYDQLPFEKYKTYLLFPGEKLIISNCSYIQEMKDHVNRPRFRGFEQTDKVR
jgi:hypothetical protein